MSLYYEVDFDSSDDERFHVGATFQTQFVHTRPRNADDVIELRFENVGRVLKLFETIQQNGSLEVMVPRRYREAIEEIRAAGKEPKIAVDMDIRLTSDGKSILRLHAGKARVSMLFANMEGDLTVLLNAKDVSMHAS